MAPGDPNGNSLSADLRQRTITARGISVSILLVGVALGSLAVYEHGRIERSCRETIERSDAARAAQVEMIVARFDAAVGLAQAEARAAHGRISQDTRILTCIVAMSPALRANVITQTHVEWAMVCPGIMSGP